MNKQAEQPSVCPSCNSENIAFGLGVRKRNKIAIIFLSLFSGVPLENIKGTYYCKECKTDFKA